MMMCCNRVCSCNDQKILLQPIVGCYKKILQRKRSLMQPILGCNNKYGNEQKRKCNQFLVERVKIATTLLVASGFIGTTR
jgi:hypothetical protein